MTHRGVRCIETIPPTHGDAPGWRDLKRLRREAEAATGLAYEPYIRTEAAARKMLKGLATKT